MPLLPVAILAQVLTASVGDRMEARELVQKNDQLLEAENAAYATAAVDFTWLTLRGTYSPSLLVTPLETSPRVVSLTHTVTGSANSSVTLYESARFVAAVSADVSYLQQDFRRQLLGSPVAPLTGPPSDTPPSPTTPVSDLTPSEAVRVNGVTMRTGTAVAGATLLERLSRRDTLGEYAAYTASTGLDDVSRDLYPLAHGPRAGVGLLYGLDPRNTLTLRTDGQLTFVPSSDERAWIAGAAIGINHQFSRRTTGDVAIGVAYTRSEEGATEPVSQAYPISVAGLSYNDRVAQGRLYARLELSYLPVLDRTEVVYDPRVTSRANVSWSERYWSLYVNAESGVSTAPENVGSLSAASGNAGATYDLGAGFELDLGVRVAWQNYYQATPEDNQLPLTWVAFAALAWNYDFFETESAR